MSATSYVYVASSWRNAQQPAVVAALRARGFGVYDFRNPDGGTGFAWSEVGLQRENDVSPVADYLAALEHERAVRGFQSDFDAMQAADTFVLVLPCGRSAHLELGWAVGAGKRTVILLDDPCTPELMYRMVDHLARDLTEVMDYVGDPTEIPAPEAAAPADADTVEAAAKWLSDTWGVGPNGRRNLIATNANAIARNLLRQFGGGERRG